MSDLKFWQGIAVVVLALATAGVVWLGIIVVVLVGQTARRINEIGKL